MITISIILLILGILFHRNNFLVICMILELIYLLLAFLILSFSGMDFFVLIILGITGSETAIGLSILLGYYLRMT